VDSQTQISDYYIYSEENSYSISYIITVHLGSCHVVGFEQKRIWYRDNIVWIESFL